MKYLTKFTNKVTTQPGMEHLIDEGLNDIRSGKLQREIIDNLVLKCKATGRKLSLDSAIMEVWCYSNENPVDDVVSAFTPDLGDEYIRKQFTSFSLKCEVFEMRDGKYEQIFVRKDKI